jgi:hypothetical protein
MKKLKKLFGCEPAQFVDRSSSEKQAADRVAFFRRFCDEQPMVIAFMTKYGTPYAQYQTWTARSIQIAQELWWNFIANNLMLPPAELGVFEKHYVINKEFVEKKAAAARNKGMKQFSKLCMARDPSGLRSMAMASLFDSSQSRMIGPTDQKEAPELVRDQNHMHALIGAVLDAFEEVAVEPATRRKNK